MERLELEFSEKDEENIALEMLRGRVASMLESWTKMSPRDVPRIKEEARELLETVESGNYEHYRNSPTYQLLKKRIVDGNVHLNLFYNDLHAFGTALGLMDSPAVQEYSEPELNIETVINSLE